MPIPTLLGARIANEPDGKNLADRLPMATVEAKCLQLMRAMGGETSPCTRPEGHGGLCAYHNDKGAVVMVSRWARRR